MPPSNVKTIKEIIFWQYAKIVSESAGMGKKNYGMIMNTYKNLLPKIINRGIIYYRNYIYREKLFLNWGKMLWKHKK